jgi:hypothetical protein
VGVLLALLASRTCLAWAGRRGDQRAWWWSTCKTDSSRPLPTRLHLQRQRCLMSTRSRLRSVRPEALCAGSCLMLGRIQSRDGLRCTRVFLATKRRWQRRQSQAIQTLTLARVTTPSAPLTGWTAPCTAGCTSSALIGSSKRIDTRRLVVAVSRAVRSFLVAGGKAG